MALATVPKYRKLKTKRVLSSNDNVRNYVSLKKLSDILKRLCFSQTS